ncbi:MAG: hypothetical protein JWR62_1610 [Modestobacter sp.]|jgi:hypothetical protein|nr:hypothetical protein [Modestobacter sp.]
MAPQQHMVEQEAVPDAAPFLGEDWQEAWRRHLAASRELAHVGRWCDVDLVIRCGDRTETFQLVAGQPVVAAAPRAERIVLEGSSERWSAFLQPLPPPFHNAVLGMDRRCADFSIAEGRELLVRHLRALTVVLDGARAAMAAVRAGG